MSLAKYLLPIAVMVTSLSTAPCQQVRIDSRSLERDIAKYAAQHNYSGSILIQDRDGVIMRRSFGKADQQFNIPNGAQTKYKLASVTKLFTAVLILQLYDQGRIDLRQPIKTYLPDYKGEGASKVTVYHLLTATSGLEDYGRGDREVYLKRLSTDELINQFCSGRLVTEPGTKFNYNNADYVILGKIIEHVTGKSYEEALKQFILEPLLMANSGLCKGAVVPQLSHSYMWDADNRKVVSDEPYRIENFYAAGAMYSTPDDLLRFSNALYGGKLLKPDTLKLLLKPQLGNYACGLWIYHYDLGDVSLPVAERQGSIAGTTNRMLRVLDRDVTILLLTNMDSANLDDLQIRIMSKFVPAFKSPELKASITPFRINGKVGTEIALPVTLTNTGGTSARSILDIEIKDETGVRVAQIVKEPVDLEIGKSKDVTFSWKPTRAGRYTVSFAVFQSDWIVNRLWVNSAAIVVVE